VSQTTPFSVIGALDEIPLPPDLTEVVVISETAFVVSFGAQPIIAVEIK